MMTVTRNTNLLTGKKTVYFLTTIALVFFSTVLFAQNSTKTFEPIDFNFGWRFALDSITKPEKISFNDSKWKAVQLPHDWSVEFPFDSTKEGATGYLPGGMSWYRKHFKTTAKAGEQTIIMFDGVYNNATIFVNGKKLFFHPYGYAPFNIDLTAALNPTGRDNVIAVQVDRTRYVDSRWYSGSGIYRNVKLVVQNKIAIPVWGTFITTPSVNQKQAIVQVKIDVANSNNTQKNVIVQTEIYDATGKKISSKKSTAQIKSSVKNVLTHEFAVSQPKLWSVDKPTLYKAVVSLHENGKLIAAQTTAFGIRSIRFDANTGFYLNGVNMKIKGVCLHHDGGLVGAAVPKGVWQRRLQILKDGGCNAIRLSHNPGSQEFLDLCDEMGFLVQDEFYDEWDYPKDKRLNSQERHDDYLSRGHAEHFQEWAETDLKNTMLAHRNHPSVFQWSIGNEIEWTYKGNREITGFFNADWKGGYFFSRPPYSPERIREEYAKFPKQEYTIGGTAQKLANWTREMDTTRPVIANCILPSASFETGYTDALDIVGFSYRRVMYDYAKEYYPGKIVMGTENVPQWQEWKAIEERPFVSGTFLWTGIDYMGESNEKWPVKTNASGLINTAGFTKEAYHMYKTLWQNKPSIYVASNTAAASEYKEVDGKVVEKKEGKWEKALWFWHKANEHWNYKDGEPVIVEVLSNCTEVELFLNNKSLGKKMLSEFPDRIYKWALPYTKGTLTAKGTGSKGMAETSIVTTSEPVAIKFTTDKMQLKNDGYDVAHLIVQLVDKNGNPVVDENRRINFSIIGNAKWLGVDNGNPANTQAFQRKTIVTDMGHALAIIQANLATSEIVITANADGLKPTLLKIKIR